MSLAAAEAELRRLGYGVEVIDVITDTGTRFTSYVGDACWDTAGNRARVRAHHQEIEASLARANEASDDYEARWLAECRAHGETQRRLDAALLRLSAVQTALSGQDE